MLGLILAATVAFTPTAEPCTTCPIVVADLGLSPTLLLSRLRRAAGGGGGGAGTLDLSQPTYNTGLISIF